MEANCRRCNIETITVIILRWVIQNNVILHSIGERGETLGTHEALHTWHIVHVVEVTNVLGHLKVVLLLRLSALHTSHAI